MSTGVVSQPEAVDSPESVREKAEVERTASLLIECRKKIRSLARQHDELTRQLDEVGGSGMPAVASKKRARIDDQISRLMDQSIPVVSATEELVRYASGLIENARLPILDKIELKLRNAELEAELIQIRRQGFF